MAKLEKNEAEKYILDLIDKQPYEKDYVTMKTEFVDMLDTLYKKLEKDFPDSNAEDVNKIFKEHYKFDVKTEQKKIKNLCSKIISWMKDNKPTVEGYEWKFDHVNFKDNFYEYPDVDVYLKDTENKNHYFRADIVTLEVVENTKANSGNSFIDKIFPQTTPLSKDEARTLIAQLIEDCPKLSEYTELAESFWRSSVEYLSQDKTYETISVTTDEQVKLVEKSKKVCEEIASWVADNVKKEDSNGNNLKWKISSGSMRNFYGVKITVSQGSASQNTVTFTGVLEVFSSYRDGENKYFPQNIDSLFEVDKTATIGKDSSDNEIFSTGDKTSTSANGITQRATPESVAAAKQNDKSHTPLTKNILADTLGAIEVSGFMGNSEEVKKRQHMLNMNDYDEEYKTPNPNKFPNNEDAYPVDLKIEELESHMPNIKLYQVLCHEKAKEAAVAAMEVARHAEKRIVKLENILSTMMRLIFRIGARVPINCQYYGGQSPFNKYFAIRCMCDDRIQDGQLVQLDQCLYCTRYEPVYGQVYELVNDTGVNVAAILDDNQMSYRNIEHYVTDARTEKYHNEIEKASIDMTMIQTRSKEETDFKDIWGKGIAMNWHYVPKELQKCHINWRQSINDDGTKIGRLESFPSNENNAGSNILNSPLNANANTSLNSSSGVKTMTQQRVGMENYMRDDNYVKEAINTGKKLLETSLDDAKNKISANFQADIKKILGDDSSIDMLTIACITYATGEDANTVTEKYKKFADEIGTTNPALIVSAYGCDNVEIIIGSKEANEKENSDTTVSTSVDTKISKIGNSLARIDRVNYPKTNEDSQNKSLPTLNWEQRDSWLWADFSERLIIQAGKIGKTVEAASLFPKVCYLYCEMSKACLMSPYDTEEYAFPFSEKELKEEGIAYTSPFGQIRGYNEKGDAIIHRGIDLGAWTGVPFRAVHDGTVTDGEEPWDTYNHAILLDHGDGTYSRYLHGDIKCTVGQKVKKGEILGTVNTYGHSGGPHLHFEMSRGDAYYTYSDTDPLDFFPKAKAAAVLGELLPC